MYVLANSTIKYIEKISRYLTCFYIYIKHTFLRQFVYNGFNVHRVHTSASNRYKKYS